jgi:hypothetical protein
MVLKNFEFKKTLRIIKMYLFPKQKPNPHPHAAPPLPPPPPPAGGGGAPPPNTPNPPRYATDQHKPSLCCIKE